MDFQIIVHGPYHFGDDAGFFGSDEPVTDLPSPHDFRFKLPGYSRGRGHAILMFQTRNVNAQHNLLEINGHPLPLRPGVESWKDKNSWSQQVLMVEGEWLDDDDNRLTVAAKDDPGGDFDQDDFAVADLVMLYHSADSSGVLSPRPSLPRK